MPGLCNLLFIAYFSHFLSTQIGLFLPCNNHFAGGQQTILPTTSEETTTSSSSPNSSIVATTSTPGADMQPVAAHYQQVAYNVPIAFWGRYLVL